MRGKREAAFERLYDGIWQMANTNDSLKTILNPFWIGRRFWGYRELIRQLTWREVVMRYKGSYIGLGWSFVQPLLMLCVYTFVFSVVFRARWGMRSEETRIAFALTLFMGIITFNLFAEMLNASPTIVLRRVNLVKKIVFPLDVLPLVQFLSVLVNSLFSLSVLFVGMLLVYGAIPWTAVFLPLVWLPMMMLSLGCGYFMASLGVFIRDFNAVVRVVTMMLFFLSPIFYPVSAVPPDFRVFIKLNPVAIFVESARRVFIWGMAPEWSWFVGGAIFSFFTMASGYAWFMKSRKAFVDVM